MLKHVFWLGLAIAVGLAVAKMFGGTFNLSSLFGGLTGTTTTTTPCHLAAIAFREDFRTGPRVNLVRSYLRKFEKEGPGQAALVRMYRENGRKMAARVERSRFLSAMNRMLFRVVLRRAEGV